MSKLQEATSGFDSLLDMVRRATIGYKNTAGSGSSIADISKIGRVEPITLVSSNLKSVKQLYDIQQGILNIYAGFYIQGVSILATKLVDSRILKILDSVNPDRDMKTLLTSVSIESIDSRIPARTEHEYVDNVRNFLALEALEFGGARQLLSGNRRIVSDVKEMLKSRISTEDIEELEEFFKPEPLEAKATVGALKTQKVDSFERTEKVVGKVIEVSFQVGDKANEVVTLPVVIKLDNMVVPGEVLTNILTMNEDSITIGSRFKDALAGRIGFIKDFLLCSDLIKKQKSTMMKDPSRAYASMLNRVNKSRIYSILSRNVSLSTISGIMMISELEEAEIKAKIGGDLTNKRTRNIIFDNSSVMIIAVVDREWEKVTVFVRDYDGHSEIPFNNFKDSTTGNTDALVEVFKSMSVGRVPTF